ncbi:MAG: CoA transferase [Chloroflexi bacterium]|nr:CoA transferase [Chloroflexota bacterium]
MSIKGAGGTELKKPALKGIRILDLGVAVAVPVATRNLALFGAEVIRIESAGRPDVTRFGSYADNKMSGEFWNKSARFNSINTNKKSLALDLSKPRGIEIFKELVKKSDVVAENWSPRVKRNLGLDWESLAKIKPDIIMVSASGYGDSGPWADWAAWGLAVDAMTGLAHVTGYRGGPPVKMIAPVSDWIGAEYVTLSILMALEYRHHTGKGQWIDISEMEAAAMHLGEAIVEHSVNGKEPMRMGNRHQFMAPHGCYRCKGNDRWVTIAVTSDKEWDALSRALGSPAWTKDEKFSSGPSRWHNQDELDAHIEGWTMEHENREVMELLQKAGVPAAAVLNSRDLHLDTHLNQRGYFHKVRHPQAAGNEDMGTRIYPGAAWKTPGAEPQELSAAPRLGQDNRDILVNLLGLSEDEVEKLAKEGVIGTKPTEADRMASSGWGVVPPAKQIELGIINEYDPDYKKNLGVG